MVTIEVKGFESVDFPDGTTEEQMSRAIQKGIADGSIKQMQEAEQVEDWKSGDPTAMAQEIVKREGNTTFEDAYERVVGFPRREKALLEGTSFPIVSTAFDVASAPARGLMGAVSALGGTDPSERMAQPNVNSGTGFFGTADDMLQNAITDPLTLVGAGISTPIKAGASQVLPKAGSFLTGAIEGGVTGATEYALEQAKRGETGEALQTPLDAGIQIGTGGLISGSGSKLGDALGSKELSTRQEVRQTQKELDKVASDAIPEGVDAFAWGQVTPMNRVGFNPNTKPEKGEIDYKELLSIGKASAEGVEGAINPLEHTFREVGLPAFKEYESILGKVGADLGKIRDEHGSKIIPISKDKLLENFSEGTHNLGKYNLKSVNLRESIGKDGQKVLEAVNSDGSVIGGKIGKQLVEDLEEAEGGLIRAFDRDGDIVRKKVLNPKVTDLMETLEDFPNDLTGNKLDMLREKVNSLVDKDPVSSQPLKSKENSLIQGIAKTLRNNIDDGIEELDPSIVGEFQALRSEYGQLKNNRDILGGLIGKTIKTEDGETTKKGTSALKRVVQSLQDQGSNIVWEDVKKRTGYDVKRASARALEAMVVNNDDKAKSLLGELGLLNKSVASIQNPISLEGAKKGFDISKEFIKPTALPSLQVEKQGVSNTSSLLEEMAPEPYADFTSSFAPYMASGSRSGVRDAVGMFSGEQESNKVTENPLGAIGQNMVNEGKGN